MQETVGIPKKNRQVLIPQHFMYKERSFYSLSNKNKDVT